MPSPPTAPRALPAVIGAAGGCVLVGAWALGYGLGITPFPPFDLADLFIRYSPGGLATWAIETFGHTAQRLVLAGGVVTFVGIAALFGLLGWSFRAVRRSGWATAPAAPLVVTLAWWAEDGLGIDRLIWLGLFFTTTLGLAGSLVVGRLRRLDAEYRPVPVAEGQASHWLDQPGDYGRRELLRQVAGLALLGAGGGLAGWLLRRAGVGDVATAAGTPLPELRANLSASPVAAGNAVSLPTPVPAGPRVDSFDAPPGLRPRYTSNADFYVVDISTRDPALPEDDWTLRIHGLVDRELRLSYRDLLALPAVELDGSLLCISFLYGSDLISTTRWTGVPLRTLLEQAGVRDGALDIIAHGAGGYSDSIPLSKAMEQTTLLVYGMDGEALPRGHGFPCRLYAPGLYGEKSVKWLRELELVDYDYSGYWQERGWTDEAVVNTISIIDTPSTDTLRGAGGLVPIAGIAFAGTRGISAVQVRVDDGAWQDATLEPYAPPLVWQRWRFDWHPEPGTYELTVRAVDGDGNPQEERERDPHPDGMTGLHRVEVNVA